MQQGKADVLCREANTLGVHARARSRAPVRERPRFAAPPMHPKATLTTRRGPADGLHRRPTWDMRQFLGTAISRAPRASTTGCSCTVRATTPIVGQRWCSLTEREHLQRIGEWQRQDRETPLGRSNGVTDLSREITYCWSASGGTARVKPLERRLRLRRHVVTIGNVDAIPADAESESPRN